MVTELEECYHNYLIKFRNNPSVSYFLFFFGHVNFVIVHSKREDMHRICLFSSLQVDNILLRLIKM